MGLIHAITRLVKRTPALYRAWRVARRVRRRLGLGRLPTSAAALRRHAAAALTADHSYAGEAAHLLGMLRTCGIHGGIVVDIAAGDGVTQSCTLPLFRDPAWGGLAVELDPDKAVRLEHAYRPFESVRTVRERVTPANVEALLRDHDVPDRFEVLNLDIDSFDLWVMTALLRTYRPAVITMEVNEKVPPPIYFAVDWDPGHVWQEDHFYGCSLTAAAALVRPCGYILEGLHFNNAFFIRADVAAGRIEDRDVAEAYACGYRDRPGRVDLFPWNHDVEHLHELEPAAIVRDLETRFAKYAGQFEVRVHDREPNGSGSTSQGVAHRMEAGHD